MRLNTTPFPAVMRIFARTVAATLCAVLVLCYQNLISHPVHAQTPQIPPNPPSVDWAKVHSVTVEAMNAMYNLRFTEAEQKCNDVITMAPSDPRGHFFKAMLYFYRQRLFRTPADYQRFLQLAQNTVSVCENVLKSAPNDSKALFYMGGIIGYRGLARFFNKEDLMKAAWDGKKGFDYLNDAVKSDPNNADAQMGFGLFNYLISQAPAFVKTALRVTGLSGDRNVGLRQLEYAAANGLYGKIEAQIWLSDFYDDFEETIPRAQLFLKKLTGQFPQNIWFHVSNADVLLNSLRKPEEAFVETQYILAQNSTDKRANGFACLFAASSMMYKGKYADAQQWAQKCLSVTNDTVQIRNANFIAGYSNELSGNRSAAMPYYQKAPGHPQVPNLLARQPNADELLLSKVQFAFRGGDYTLCVQLADELLKRSSITDDMRASALYFSARSCHEKEDFAQAEQRFSQGAQIQPKEDKWLQPFCYCRLGLTQSKAGKKAEAKQSLDRALTFKDYSNEDYMRRLAGRELVRLAR